MKPKLKDHVFFTPTEDGVFFSGPSGTFILKGARLYDWIEQMVPYLQGETELATLVAPLTIERKKIVNYIVQQLWERGYIKDVAADEPHELTQAEQETYADSIRFIDDWQSSAGRRFQAFRTANMVVVGRGRPLIGLARGFFQAGLRHLVTLSDDPGVDSALAAETSKHRQIDPQFIWEHRVVDINTMSADLMSALAQADVIALVGDKNSFALVEEVSSYVRKSGKLLLTGLTAGGVGWVGPMLAPNTNGCWFCALERLRATGQELEGAALPVVGEMFIGQLVAFELFKYITGVMPPQSMGAVLRLEPDRLGITRHVVAPSPRCACTGFAGDADGRAVMETWRATASRTPDKTWEMAVPFIDDVTGLIVRVEPGDLAQAPLCQCAATLRLPEAPSVVAAERDHVSARLAALRLGLQTYAATLASTLDATPGAWDQQGMLLRNVNVRDFPFVSGYTWHEWLGQGLLALAADAAHGALLAGSSQVHRVNDMELDSWHHFLLKTITIRYGLPLEVYLVHQPAVGGIQSVAIFSGQHLLTVAAERVPMAAIERALTTVAHALQELANVNSPLEWAYSHPRVTVPPKTVARETVDIPRTPTPNWEDWTPKAAQVAEAEGSRLALRPFTADRAVFAAGLLTGWVGLV